MNKSELHKGMSVVINAGAELDKGFKPGDVMVFLYEETSYGGKFRAVNGQTTYLRWSEVSPLSQTVTMNNTPATQKGIQVGDKVVDVRNGATYTLVADNGGNRPLFKNDYTGAETNLHIHDVKKASLPETEAKTPAEEAGIEVGTFVRGNYSGDYYYVTNLGDGKYLKMNNLTSGKFGLIVDVTAVTKVTEAEAEAATTPSALKGWKVGDYFEITGGSYGKVGDIIKMTKDSGNSWDNTYVNAVTGVSLKKDYRYVRKLSVAEAEAKIAELKKTPLERAGFKVGEQAVVYGSLYIINADNGGTVDLIYGDGKHVIAYIEELNKYDGDYMMLTGLKVGDIVVASGSCVMRDGELGVLKSNTGSLDRIACNGDSTVTVKIERGIHYPSIKYLRKATKEEVLKYLRNATGNVDAEIVKFAIA